jgi:hypothetical protein
VKAQPPGTGGSQNASPEISEAAFGLKLRQISECNVGRIGRAEAILMAKDPYHVNQEYPLTFQLHESPGIKYPRVTITKDFVQVESKRAVLPFEFTPERTGHLWIMGTLKFSVCNNHRCLIEKRDVKLDLFIH